MRKDELILNDKPNTIVDGFAQVHYSETDVLSAMEQHAIAFAEWIDDNYIRTAQGLWYDPNDTKTFEGLSTSELYTLFNNPTNGE